MNAAKSVPVTAVLGFAVINNGTEEHYNRDWKIKSWIVSR